MGGHPLVAGEHLLVPADTDAQGSAMGELWPEGPVIEAQAMPQPTAGLVEREAGREHDVEVDQANCLFAGGLGDPEGPGDKGFLPSDREEPKVLAGYTRVRDTHSAPVTVLPDSVQVGFVPDGRKQGHPCRRLVPGLLDEPPDNSAAGLLHELVGQGVPARSRIGPDPLRLHADLRVHSCLTVSASVSSAGPFPCDRYAGASSFVVLPTRTDSSSR